MSTIIRPLNRNLWKPFTDGVYFNKLKKKFSEDPKKYEEDTNNTIKSTSSILSQCIDPFKNYEEQSNNRSTGLVIGDVQSGKTTSMTALTHLAHDNNFKIIVILSGNVGSLARQTAFRFDDLELSWGWEKIRNDDKESIDETTINNCQSALETWTKSYDEEERKTIVITSFKLHNRIEMITDLFRELANSHNLNECPVLIIDDESDHYSLNSSDAIRNQKSNIKRNIEQGRAPRSFRIHYYQFQEGDNLDEIALNNEIDIDQLYLWNAKSPLVKWSPEHGEIILLEEVRSTTNRCIESLREAIPFHSYIGYTATPYANLLQQAIENLNPEFGEILKPGQDYTGSGFFFLNDKNKARYITNIDKLINQKIINDTEEQNDTIENDEIDNKDELEDYSLNHALRYFVLTNAICYHQKKHLENYKLSMMIHTHRERDQHENYRRDITNQINNWHHSFNSENTNRPVPHLNNDIDDFKVTYDELVEQKDIENIPEFNKEFRTYITRALNEIKRNIILFNASQGRIPDIPWEKEGTMSRILIGGDGLDRGYTIEGLSVSYMPRKAANQVDTQQQRARFFGYRKDTLPFTKIYLHESLIDDFEKNAKLEKQFRKDISNHLNDGKLIRDWPRAFRSRSRLTSSSKSRRSLIMIPKGSAARQNNQWQKDIVQEQKNNEIYNDILDKFNQSSYLFRDLEPGRNEKWIHNNLSKIKVDLKLSFVFEEYIKELFDDLEVFPLFKTIEEYLEENEDINCPIVMIDPETTKERTIKGAFGSISFDSGGGGSGVTDSRPSYSKFHYEYLKDDRLKNLPRSNILKVHPVLQCMKLKRVNLETVDDYGEKNKKLLHENYPVFRFLPSEKISDSWQIER